jgi:filamentous hemagglutinin family protein
VRGVNLFHSFSEFNVAASQRLYFANPRDVQNIFSRVTGSNPSSILGVLGVDGSANLFLLNPNGILFGAEAQLDLRGSFLATTGDRFTFSDNSEFSAANPQAPPLLTVNVPVGVQFGERPATLTNSGWLSVDPGQSLTLWSGNIVNQGLLTTTNGQVQLIATDNVVLDGILSIIDTDGGDILIEAGNQISVANLAEINASVRSIELDRPSGNITLRAGGNISLSGQSAIRSVVTSQATNDAGQISVRSDADIILSQATIDSRVNGSGNGALLQIRGRSLVLQDNSTLAASTNSTGHAGRIDVHTQESIFLNQNSGILANVLSGATGDGGRLNLSTRQLSVLNGSVVSSVALGSGQAGRLQISASDSILISGAIASNEPASTSAISADTLGFATAGDIVLQTRELQLGERAAISASTFGAADAGLIVLRADSIELLTSTSRIVANADNPTETGRGGDILIRGDRLFVQNGGQIATGTFGAGNAGDLTVITTETVQLTGTSPEGSPSGLFTQSTRNATGKAGTLEIRTGNLSVTDRAGVSVSGIGGDPGNLRVIANRVILEQGILEAGTAFSQNANVQLRVRDAIELRENSLISALARNDGSGGNVDIEAQYVIAFPGDSDIVANAFAGSGGNITITAQGILGLVERRAIPDNGTNDIDASSQFGEQGTVILDTPDDPSRGLIELPAEVTDAARLIAQSCREAIANGSEFYITGRGGIPPSPLDVLSGEVILTRLAERLEDPQEARSLDSHLAAAATPPITLPIVEAQGWIVQPDGAIALVAAVPSAGSTSLGSGLSFLSPSTCRALR